MARSVLPLRPAPAMYRMRGRGASTARRSMAAATLPAGIGPERGRDVGADTRERRGIGHDGDGAVSRADRGAANAHADEPVRSGVRPGDARIPPGAERAPHLDPEDLDGLLDRGSR